MKKRLSFVLLSMILLAATLLGTPSAALAADAPVIKVLIPVAGVVSKNNYVPYTKTTIKMNGNYTATDAANPANAVALAAGETYTVELISDGSKTYLMGDVDMNGTVSIADYTNIRLHILGKKSLSGEALALADVDKNGSVTISDYTYIRLDILGLKKINDSISFGLGTGVHIRNSAGTSVFCASDFRLTTANGAETIQLITNRDGYGTRDYRGTFRFYIHQNSLRLVNELDVETYLYGVLPYEMSNDFPLEALKAQAVTARNFAISSLGEPNYDLDDTSSYAQVYRGFDGSKNNCIAAVDQTRGQVLKYGDKLIACYYSASNGGWTEITQHRWTATDPLKAYDQIREDPFDIANPSSLQERIVLPKSVTTGNPVQYQKWTDGAYMANTNSPSSVSSLWVYLRALCGNPATFNILGFTTITPKTYDGQHGGAGSYNGNDVTGRNLCPDFLQADITMQVDRGSGPETVTVTIDFATLYTSNVFFIGSLGIYPVESDATNWYIGRRRYGHGIGLSQRGAQQRAKSSDPAVNTYTAILDFYYPDYPGYPDVHIETVY